MSKEPEKIFESADFVSIPEGSLISLIQNDDLQISEVQVWEYVLKWGIVQNSQILQKIIFKNVLKNTLQQCINF